MIELTRAQLSKLSAGRSALLAALDAGDVKASGNGALFRRFVETLDEFDPMFNVIEP
jgi:alkyl sulfatase BDS1-like metallo-beta-lactamase superfamily hydrolase